MARLEPEDANVLEALSRIYRRSNALIELAGVFRRQVALETDARKKRELLYELATLCEDKLADPASAVDAYQQLLTLEPSDPNAMTALHELLAGTERWDDLAVHMGREIALAQQQGKAEEALELQVRLGKLQQQRLQDPRGAF